MPRFSRNEVVHLLSRLIKTQVLRGSNYLRDFHVSLNRDNACLTLRNASLDVDVVATTKIIHRQIEKDFGKGAEFTMTRKVPCKMFLRYEGDDEEQSDVHSTDTDAEYDPLSYMIKNNEYKLRPLGRSTVVSFKLKTKCEDELSEFDFTPHELDCHAEKELENILSNDTAIKRCEELDRVLDYIKEDDVVWLKEQHKALAERLIEEVIKKADCDATVDYISAIQDAVLVQTDICIWTDYICIAHPTVDVMVKADAKNGNKLFAHDHTFNENPNWAISIKNGQYDAGLVSYMLPLLHESDVLKEKLVEALHDHDKQKVMEEWKKWLG